ncbi:transmembrane protein 268 isoform X1 [Trichogramma pretiosum]|uniref:transmembrane protein 268 isoform X1 n=1 Tax=Trichogramma pretiosum TaxID=7493 RepID=UPI0006C9795F|nr:transmembrane protein 268 isoform X1 [Trichogramma pretiosum]XP_014232696.1 transmembrane protein 268 isoform X1 [Trichogramma pretiosum]
MSLPVAEDATDNAAAIPLGVQPKQTREWVKFDEDSPGASSTPKKSDQSDTSIPALIKPDSVTVDITKINRSLDTSESEHKNAENHSGAAVISANSVHVNLDRSGLNRSITNEVPEVNVQPSAAGVFNPKSASLKTIDLRDANNGRSNVINTPIGVIRQGFANGDTIVTLLPVNTKWPWITPAKFRPELVPEELMAQGLTLTVEDYVQIMELLTNDVRFNVYNICYKRILVAWICTAFAVLLGLLFSGATGLPLFGLGVMWLIMNAVAIFVCMFIKIKINQNLERCMAQVNKHLLRHKILLGLDDRGKISCHKVNLCFIYFDTTDCIKKLQEVIEREERDGRIIGTNSDESSRAKRQRELQQRMDIDDSDIVIQGSTTTRVSRKQERAEMLLLRYASRWSHHYVRHQLDLSIDSQERLHRRLNNASSSAANNETRNMANNSSMATQVTTATAPRHCISARCPCQFIEEHLKYKPKGYPPGFTWCAYLTEPAVRNDLTSYYDYAR